MTLHFVVPGKPVGTNSAYRRGTQGKNQRGFYLSPDAKAFKERLRAYAVKATHEQGWKKPTPTQECAVSIIVWNAKRFDADSPTKFILDSMQGVVYGNDHCVGKVSAARSFDDGEVRVEILVKLL